MPYYLTRSCPIDTWRVTTERPSAGEWVELHNVQWWSEAQAEADRRNGKGGGEQGVLEI